MTERLRVREIDDDEGSRLVRIIRRGSGSVVTWRRAQMVLLSAQGMDVPAILVPRPAMFARSAEADAAVDGRLIRRYARELGLAWWYLC